MKTTIAVFLFIISFNLYAQQQPGWVSIGREIGYDFYYKQNTIVRGDNPFVIVVGIPMQTIKDALGVKVKYVSVNVLFYNSSVGMRVRISNHIYYYDDESFTKPGLPARDMPITHYALLTKLYDAIR